MKDRFPPVEDALRLTNLAIATSRSIAGQQATRDQDIASNFLTAVAYNAYTHHRIWNPTADAAFTGLSENGVAFDVSGAFAVLRVMYENLLHLHHVLIAPPTPEERAFRMDLWERHASAERVALAVAIKSQHPHRERVLAELEDWNAKIKASPYFQALSEGAQKEILNKGKWTLLSAVELARDAGIHETFYRAIYKELSGFAHAESLSQAFQRACGDVRPDVLFRPRASTYACMTIASTLLHTAAHIPQVEQAIRASEQVRFWSELWKHDLGDVQPLDES